MVGERGVRSGIVREGRSYLIALLSAVADARKTLGAELPSFSRMKITLGSVN